MRPVREQPAGPRPTNGGSSGGSRLATPADQRHGIEHLRHAVHVFIAAERRLRGRYQRSGESLSHAHLRALFVLTTEREATAGRLAREAELNSASVTAMVDQLEARGLVQRRRDGQDRRACWISLTDEGRFEVAEQEARWRRRLAEAFADTSDQDLEAASRVLERLAAVFETQPVEEPTSPEPGIQGSPQLPIVRSDACPYAEADGEF